LDEVYGKIKNYWLAPEFTKFPYNEQRDAHNDILYLMEKVEELQSTCKRRGKKIILLQNQIIEEGKDYEKIIEELLEINTVIKTYNQMYLRQIKCLKNDIPISVVKPLD
jgi:NTP pyrophosphatase (non-canonical NTP hydrolase)